MNRHTQAHSLLTFELSSTFEICSSYLEELNAADFSTPTNSISFITTTSQATAPSDAYQLYLTVDRPFSPLFEGEVNTLRWHESHPILSHANSSSVSCSGLCSQTLSQSHCVYKCCHAKFPNFGLFYLFFLCDEKCWSLSHSSFSRVCDVQLKQTSRF